MSRRGTGNGLLRKLVIHDLTKTWENKGIVRQCVKKVTKGNIVWSVWQSSGAGVETQKYILCSLLIRSQGNGWEVKSTWDESCGPYYHSCPLSFLDEVPCPDSRIAREWRADVLKNTPNCRGFKDGGWVRLKKGLKPKGCDYSLRYVKIKSVRPLRFCGYKIARKFIEAAVPEIDAWIEKIKTAFPAEQLSEGGIRYKNSFRDYDPDPDTRERMTEFARQNPCPELEFVDVAYQTTINEILSGAYDQNKKEIQVA